MLSWIQDHPVLDWIQDHPVLVWTFVGASVLVSLGSVLAMPAVLVRIRSDYFTHSRRPPAPWVDQHPLLRLTLGVGKNVLGGLFLLAGLLMLVLPGQGLLTLIVGFLLVDFPGKYRIEKWLVGRRYVLRLINWLRRRHGRPPLEVGIR